MCAECSKHPYIKLYRFLAGVSLRGGGGGQGIFSSYLGIIPWLLLIYLNGVNTENIENTLLILPLIMAAKKG